MGDYYYKVPTGARSKRELFWTVDQYDRVSLYARGEDGSIHEYALDPSTSLWDETFKFPSTITYASMVPSRAGSTTTIHAITTTNNTRSHLKQWWKIANSSSPGTFHEGQEAPYPVYRNSSLAFSVNGPHVIYQDDAGKLFAIGWTGHDEAEQWGRPSDIGITAMLGTTLIATSAETDEDEDGATHLFLQQTGNDIVHYVGNGMEYTFKETLVLD